MQHSKYLAVALALVSSGTEAFAVGLPCDGTQNVMGHKEDLYFAVTEGDLITVTRTSNPTVDEDYYFNGYTNYFQSFEPGVGIGSSYSDLSADLVQTFIIPSGHTVANILSHSYYSTASCTHTSPPSIDEIASLNTAASNISANGQMRAIGTALGNNARSRLGGGSSNVVSRSQLFVSTQNLNRSQLESPELNAWVSAEGRSYSGGFDGYSANVVLGVDHLFSETFLSGVMLGYGRTDVEDARGSVVMTSPTVGAYFAKKFAAGVILDGYLSLARPEYQADGANFRSDRVSVAFSLSGEYLAAKATVRPFARLSGYSEKQPSYVGSSGQVIANDVDSYSVSLGARYESSMEFGSTGMMPYVSAALDYGHSRSMANGVQSFASPRLGFGVSGALGAGNLNIDIDGGKVSSGTYDVGIRASYDFAF